MSKQITRTEQTAAEKADRIRLARAKILDGTISAISVDTCIFTEASYRLEHGVLNRLEQFKGNTFRLIFSEVTLREVHGHIVKHSDEAKAKLVSALRNIGKYWHVHVDNKSLVVEDLIGTDSSKAIASKRIQDFMNKCGANMIDAKAMLDVSELLKHYFNEQPPFESSADKKSEFPDAITLLSLAAWAKKEHTAVLFVTKDKGCKRFCESSELLYAIDDLSEALTAVQARDAHRAELCRELETKIVLGNYPDLIAQIETALAENIWSIDWVPEADAAYYYEPEIQDVEVVKAEFVGFNGCPEFMAVDYRDEMLVVETSIALEIDATCSFSFSVKDSIDRDMVSIGDATVCRKMSVEVDILLTFENPASEVPEIVEVELIPTHCRIDFGSVEPDYGDEDPNSEYY